MLLFCACANSSPSLTFLACFTPYSPGPSKAPPTARSTVVPNACFDALFAAATPAAPRPAPTGPANAKPAPAPANVESPLCFAAKCPATTPAPPHARTVPAATAAITGILRPAVNTVVAIIVAAIATPITAPIILPHFALRGCLINAPTFFATPPTTPATLASNFPKNVLFLAS